MVNLFHIKHIRKFLQFTAFSGFTIILLSHLIINGKYVTFSKMLSQYHHIIAMRVLLLPPIILALIFHIFFNQKASGWKKLNRQIFFIELITITFSLCMMTSGDGIINWKMHTGLTYLFCLIVLLGEPVFVMQQKWSQSKKRSYILLFYGSLILPIIINPWLYRIDEVFIVYYLIVRLYFDGIDRDLNMIRLEDEFKRIEGDEQIQQQIVNDVIQDLK